MDETVSREIVVNGCARVCPVRSLGELLEELGHAAQQQGIAAAVNGEVVPRTRWHEHPLNDGDTVDIVGAVQGG